MTCRSFIIGAAIPLNYKDKVVQGMEIQQAAEQFLSYLRDQKRYSPNTVRAYEVDLMHWVQVLRVKQGIKDVEVLSAKLEPGHLRSYLSDLYDSHEKSSLCRRLSAIRSFLKYLRLHGLTDRDIGVLVPTPKMKKTLPEFLKIEEMSELIEAPDASTNLGRRDRAIFEILYGCGLRVSEAVGLNLGDVDFHNGWVTVMGKGSKQRTVPFGPPAREALENYLSNTASPRTVSPKTAALREFSRLPVDGPECGSNPHETPGSHRGCPVRFAARTQA